MTSTLAYMTSTQTATIARALEVIAENAGRRYVAGATTQQATAGAVAEFSARFPRLGSVCAGILGLR